MPILYNCRHDGDQFRITKFDEDQNPVSSYLCTERECECPAGKRPMCRHREMLPRFLHRNAVGTGWWYDYDRGGWVQMHAEVEFVPAGLTLAEPIPPLPEGVQVLSLDKPAVVHNAIAEAIGEPEAHIDWDEMAEKRLGQDQLAKRSWRRF